MKNPTPIFPSANPFLLAKDFHVSGTDSITAIAMRWPVIEFHL
jgi:hypothetical protein